MTPIITWLMENGLTLLAGAVRARGQEFVEQKLGVSLDAHMGSEDGRIKLAQIQAEREGDLLEVQMHRATLDAEVFKAEVADKGSARQRDVQKATRNLRADLMFLLAVGITAALVWIVWKDQSINEYVKGIFTLVLGRFLGYLDNIYNFEFGTTRGSQNKDETIKNLTGSGS